MCACFVLLFGGKGGGHLHPSQWSVLNNRQHSEQFTKHGGSKGWHGWGDWRPTWRVGWRSTESSGRNLKTCRWSRRSTIHNPKVIRTIDQWIHLCGEWIHLKPAMWSVNEQLLRMWMIKALEANYVENQWEVRQPNLGPARLTHWSIPEPTSRLGSTRPLTGPGAWYHRDVSTWAHAYPQHTQSDMIMINESNHLEDEDTRNHLRGVSLMIVRSP